MANPRILLAESDRKSLEHMVAALSGMDVGTVGAQDGNRALALCRYEQPDAVLVSAELTSINGASLCQQIKNQLDPSLPVVLIFAAGAADAAEAATACGADNFLLHPCADKELQFCVRSLLTLRDLLKSSRVASAESSALVGAAAGSGMVSLSVLDALLELELLRVDRYGFPLAVAHVAVDPLPEDQGAWTQILDGQLAPSLGATVRSAVRDIDVSAFLTHREIVILMPHTDLHGAKRVAERVCDRVASQPYHFGRARIQPTASVGVLCIHGERAPRKEVLRRVARAKDQAQTDGGNRVCAG